MKLNDIFTDNNYSEYVNFANQNGYFIKEINLLDSERCFQVVEFPKPSQDELELQKTTAKQSELQSQLDELMTAHNQAVMLGDTELAEQLKAEYQSLVNGS